MAWQLHPMPFVDAEWETPSFAVIRMDAELTAYAADLEEDDVEREAVAASE